MVPETPFAVIPPLIVTLCECAPVLFVLPEIEWEWAPAFPVERFPLASLLNTVAPEDPPKLPPHLSLL